MIILDPIIRNLQSHGGITVYYNHIVEGLRNKHIPFIETNLTYRDRLPFGRYLNCKALSTKGVFHSSYYRLPQGRNLKTVTTAHDFTYERFVSGPKRWVHSWQKNRAIQSSDLVICVSQNTANDLLRYSPVPEERIRVVHNGVSDGYRPIANRAPYTNEVLFVGARDGYKNFSLTVEAIAGFPELCLSIVGGGPLSAAECAMLDNRLAKRYRWLGRLSDSELNAAYNRAYCLTYPSGYEGFGIPVLEAMRAGCPVIACNVSSIPEVAGGAGVLIDKPETGLLMEALSVLDDTKTRSRCVEEGYRQAAKFSWDSCFDKTYRVYQELMN